MDTAFVLLSTTTYSTIIVLLSIGRYGWRMPGLLETLQTEDLNTKFSPGGQYKETVEQPGAAGSSCYCAGMTLPADKSSGKGGSSPATRQDYNAMGYLYNERPGVGAHVRGVRQKESLWDLQSPLPQHAPPIPPMTVSRCVENDVQTVGRARWHGMVVVFWEYLVWEGY